MLIVHGEVDSMKTTKTKTKGKVGAMSTQDHKDPKAAAKNPAAPVAPKAEDAPDGNVPVDAQPEQSERARLRPIDQA